MNRVVICLTSLLILSGCVSSSELERQKELKIPTLNSSKLCYRLGDFNNYDYYLALYDEYSKRWKHDSFKTITKEQCNNFIEIGKKAKADRVKSNTTITPTTQVTSDVLRAGFQTLSTYGQSILTQDTRQTQPAQTFHSSHTNCEPDLMGGFDCSSTSF